MALHFVFVRIGKRPTSDLHAFELQNLFSRIKEAVWVGGGGGRGRGVGG